MRRAINALLFLLMAFAVAGAQTADSEEVKRLMNDGARAYKEGRFVEAQQFFERALELDPQGKNLLLYIARAIQQQFKPGVETPENMMRAEAAVEAYRRVIADQHVDVRHKEDAFLAVAYLYRQMKDEVRHREWLMMMANDSTASNERRADAYVVLASKSWECSYGISERKENKQTVDGDERGLSVRYMKPKAQEDFDKLQGCVREGLELIEHALALNPTNSNAWSYKTNLLRERAKLAQMEGDDGAQAEYGRLAGEAEIMQKRLQAEQAGKGEEESKDGTRVGPVGPRTEPDATPARPAPSKPTPPNAGGNPKRRVTIPAGVLNGLAVSSPAPAYPREAREARVPGTVEVQVLIDEEGAVAEAKAASGHTLLRAAAVEAARRWRFTPTLLSGRPVKVTGVIIINFTLP